MGHNHKRSPSRIIEELRRNKKPIVNKCRRFVHDPNDDKTVQVSCKKIDEEDGSCICYSDPLSKWRIGDCNMATHLEIEFKKKFVRVGQQKQKNFR